MEAADKETAEISAKQKTVEAELEKMTGGRQELTQKREELSAQIADKKLAAVAGLKEIEAHEASIAALRERQSDAASRRVQLEEQAAALEAGNAEIRRRMEEMKAQAEGLREQAKDTGRRVGELMAQRTQGEARQTALRQQSRDKADRTGARRARSGAHRGKMRCRAEGGGRSHPPAV